ncbi:MAG TPA: helix-turn-helix transcriptional regulator [Dongiaceae bacterium]
MDSSEFRASLNRLGLSQLEAARLLGVKSRTIQRWVAGSPPVGEPAAQALRAWCRLADHGIAWRPDADAIDDEDPGTLARRCQQAIGIEAMIKRVAARGGPKKRWRVNLKRRRAMAGPISVMFNTLANGGFCPASYRRLDAAADRAGDQAMIEEAIVCFAAAVAAADANWAKEEAEPAPAARRSPARLAQDGALNP